MSHFLSYLWHYVIARFIYTSASAAGISPVLLVCGTLAIVGLVWLSKFWTKASAGAVRRRRR